MRLRSDSPRPCLLMLALLALSLWLGAGIAHAQQSVQLREAHFAAPGAVQEQSVALPDTWKQRALSPAGSGRYRISFSLLQDPVDSEAWVLRAERMSRWHRVWLNGELVHASADTPESRLHASPVISWLEVPSRLLRVGSNELELELYYHRRGGLSELWLGPAAELRPGYNWLQFRQSVLPQWLNMLAAGFSLLLLLVWSERRQERALGLFATLSLLTSVRNSVYGVTVPPELIAALDLFYYLAQVSSALLLLGFALAWSEASWPRLRVATRWLALLLLPGSFIATSLGRLEFWRTWTYPSLLLLALPAIWMITQQARRLGGWRRQTLAAALLLMLAAALHDYLSGQGHLSITSSFMMPWLQPLAMMAFGSLLVERLVQALSQSERYQSDLERVVALRTNELQAANLAKSRLIDAASHDLRQPVTAVGLLVGLARLQARDAEQREVLEQASQGLRSLEDLLKGLLDYSRLERDEQELTVQPMPIQPLFDTIALHAEALARARGLRLRVRPSKAWVRSEPLLLEQVLRNLLSNAIQHTEHGTVLLALRRRGEQACLEVRDSGPGIAAADQQRIFEPFVQLNNPARARALGTGLGLAIVAQALRRLGHRIELHSAPGCGSCFRVLLPLEALTGLAPAQVLETPSTPAGSLHGLQLGLVEDDAVLREALTQQLQYWGLVVHGFADAEAALSYLDSGGPALQCWLSDHRLPGLGGAQLLTELKRRFPAVRVLLMSADMQAPQDWPDDWPRLEKPFSPQALRALLASTD
ncbi:hybrid sensor histidine kinase/response regulator [Paucibacter sp. APW11]|uniref:histidine kinase n=1 Tax=Roseateles aquae TaxID=3077235 RepID=A0ABU3PGJ5_9BURK|nr:hybrid sensor histidine kinase/response regulator [Paucibacter sp. APW11]MDT9001705.1 hybrid sensor histidine kinase/response regulator [Paucibacter sp. APW11]